MCCFFFFNDTATTEIYTLSLHDALPICYFGLFHGESMQSEHLDTFRVACGAGAQASASVSRSAGSPASSVVAPRSEEHTSELQSPCNLVCRLLLEKKKHGRAYPCRLPSS